MDSPNGGGWDWFHWTWSLFLTLYRAKPSAAALISSIVPAGEPADLYGHEGCWMLCWMSSGHSRTSTKPSEKGIKDQRKFLTDFSTHLVRFKV